MSNLTASKNLSIQLQYAPTTWRATLVAIGTSGHAERLDLFGEGPTPQRALLDLGEVMRDVRTRIKGIPMGMLSVLMRDVYNQFTAMAYALREVVSKADASPLEVLASYAAPLREATGADETTPSSQRVIPLTAGSTGTIPMTVNPCADPMFDGLGQAGPGNR